MPPTLKALLNDAKGMVPRITAAEARELIANGNTLVVDVREAPEVVESGKIAGAVHVSRGLLEFRACADSPVHDEAFATDKTVIVYCSNGGRSALAGKTLKELGFAEVYNLGAFRDWVYSGGAIDHPIESGM